VARKREIRCLGCGAGWSDAQAFEKDGGEIKQIGIALLAFCPCGNEFQAVGLLEASRLRRRRERRERSKERATVR
jgi:hypothetical protein